MKVVVSLCILSAATLVAGAPLADVFIPEPGYYSGPQPYLRAKRSYGGGYGAPCASALPALPLAPAGYGGGYGSAGHGAYGGIGGGYGGAAHGYGAAPSYGYGAPHYRSDEADEMLNFSDMDQGMSEHQPMARYGYGGGAVAAAHGAGIVGLGYGGQLAPAVASGPAFGVFPNANVGGCNVPLLLSCSPSIVPGRLVKGGYGGSGYGSGAAGYGSGAAAVVAAPNAYRGVDEQQHQDQHSGEANHSLEHTDDSANTETHQ